MFLFNLAADLPTLLQITQRQYPDCKIGIALEGRLLWDSMWLPYPALNSKIRSYPSHF